MRRETGRGGKGGVMRGEGRRGMIVLDTSHTKIVDTFHFRYPRAAANIREYSYGTFWHREQCAL